MPTLAKDKMRHYRARLKAQGLRPVQIWLPDTRTPEFIAEARRQSQLASRNRTLETETAAFIDAVVDWDDLQ